MVYNNKIEGARTIKDLPAGGGEGGKGEPIRQLKGETNSRNPEGEVL